MEKQSMAPLTNTQVKFEDSRSATTLKQVLSGRLSALGKKWRKLLSNLISLHAVASKWIVTAADHYAAAAIYEQLRRLSDAELQRRGLSRACLARDALATCDTADRLGRRPTGNTSEL